MLKALFFLPDRRLRAQMNGCLNEWRMGQDKQE